MKKTALVAFILMALQGCTGNLQAPASPSEVPTPVPTAAPTPVPTASVPVSILGNNPGDPGIVVNGGLQTPVTIYLPVGYIIIT